jgi:hypothetical protein
MGRDWWRPTSFRELVVAGHVWSDHSVGFLAAIIGLVTGMSIGCSVVLLALSGGRDKIYWSHIKRHPIIGDLARLAAIFTVVGCGVTFAYLGFVLTA